MLSTKSVAATSILLCLAGSFFFPTDLRITVGLYGEELSTHVWTCYLIAVFFVGSSETHWKAVCIVLGHLAFLGVGVVLAGRLSRMSRQELQIDKEVSRSSDTQRG